MHRAHIEGLLREAFADLDIREEALNAAFNRFFGLFEVDDAASRARERSKMRQRVEGALLAFLGFVAGIILLICLAAIASAEPLSVRVTYVRGGGNIPRAQAQRISAENISYLRAKTGADIRLRSFRVVRPFPISWTLKNAKDLLGACEAYNINRMGKIDAFHCMFPPIQDGGHTWLVGYADGVCERHGMSVSSAELTNPETGASRVLMSMIAQRHELAHLLGMREKWSEPCELAYTGVLYCLDRGQYEISQKSVNEIRNCLKDW